ncbi:periplasmic trehalase [Croceivirga lutea]|uniref:alpha,alpha-trehalase TreF n=1 Tax=Croceivirga lutea TaxID=1775167 RepID=UPI001639AD8E|nr:alpha,alpha-trehalase TreF [Croceivirga lutea]GGG41800.1 periplasmic trehalase [Croceivirga lutea]
MFRLPLFIVFLVVLSCKSETKNQQSSKVNQVNVPQVNLQTPDELFGELFVDVQLSELFKDSKTFVDCTPKDSYKNILARYTSEKQTADFDLETFVLENFEVPPSISSDFKADSTKSAAEHVASLWPVLTRQSDTVARTGSLIPLPNPYVVPGGRFREVYYWDSYFTMLGLVESGEFALIENMLDNFAHLIRTVGHIPNGNRTYYITRSQPPFFAQMVSLLAQEKGEAIYQKYKEVLKAEYDFWMNTSNAETKAFEHVVYTEAGILNRYFDRGVSPRQESYKEDFNQVQQTNGGEKMYLDLRAGAESGWDYSVRWFADGKTIETIQTTDIIPVDLNALLYGLEEILKICYADNQGYVNQLKQQQSVRIEFLNTTAWNKELGVFEDFNWVKNQGTGIKSLATVYPLFFKMATPEQADAVAKTIESAFLKPGGVLTTLTYSGQQWDAPNGWAPLQWMTFKGLQNYGHKQLADTIASRWVNLNEKVYQNTGKFVEKYNVEDMTLEAGGGEYPVQDGFGWSNGVYLAFKGHLKTN